MSVVRRAGKFAWVVLAGVAGIGSLIFGLGQDGMTGWAAVLLSAVPLSFVLYIAVDLTVSVVQKVRNYDAAVKRAGELAESLAEKNGELEEVPAQLEQARQSGLLDAVGAMLAATSGAVLRVTNTTRIEGALVLVATLVEGECPSLGARFLLRSADVQTRRGILAVHSATEGGKVFLTVCEAAPGSDAFWEDANQRADTTEATPGELELVADPLLDEMTA